MLAKISKYLYIGSNLFSTLMSQEYQVFIEASVRGYHAHFKDATVFIGGVLTCESEPDNAFDKYAVAIKNEAGHMVGHVPKELSKIFNKFLKD